MLDESNALRDGDSKHNGAPAAGEAESEQSANPEPTKTDGTVTDKTATATATPDSTSKASDESTGSGPSRAGRGDRDRREHLGIGAPTTRVSDVHQRPGRVRRVGVRGMRGSSGHPGGHGAAGGRGHEAPVLWREQRPSLGSRARLRRADRNLRGTRRIKRDLLEQLVAAQKSSRPAVPGGSMRGRFPVRPPPVI